MTDNTPSRSEPVPVVHSGAGPLATLAFIIAVGAAIGSGYLYNRYEQERQSITADVNAALVGIVDERESTIRRLQAALDKQQDTDQELEQGFLNQRSDLEVLQGEAQGLVSDLRGLQGELQTLKGSIETQKGTMESQRSDARTLQTDIRTLQGEIQALAEARRLLEENIQALQTQLDQQDTTTTAQANILQNLQGQLTSAGEDRTALVTADEQLAQSLEQQSGRIDSLDQAVATLDEDLNASDQAITQLQSRLDSQEQRFASVDETLTALGEQDDNLVATIQQVDQALVTNIEAVNQAVVDEVQELEQALSQRLDDQAGAAAVTGTLVAALGSTQAEVIDALEAIKAVVAEGGDTDAFPLTEVQYLLRMAVYQLRFEVDPLTALNALTVAEERLAMVDSAALEPVMSRLQSDIAALNTLELPDYDMLSAKITSLQQQVDQLPLQTGLSTPVQAPEVAAQDEVETRGGFWSSVQSTFSDSVVVRSRRPEDRPLIPIEQEYFLIQNLKIKLGHLQLALLNRDEQSFSSTLAEIQEWVAAYFDIDDEVGQAFLADLAVLAAADLTPSVPPVVDTLALFEDLTGERAPIQSTATPDAVPMDTVSPTTVEPTNPPEDQAPAEEAQ